ncbi:Uncharacterised protein [Enterobacter hormaechei]|nr:Uncharacterised protein [Enterobacter hormaechei]SAC91032.1 Uncharacterised protein [Enterobacter cloacae]SAE46623.1 Uncharacterised protein [Enterobacter hormaechei]SAF81059.1 Uncharacterised protein [Enterobacter hormaechei]VAF77925.1 Uncharacterised protein [Enterobacter hormaechei]
MDVNCYHRENFRCDWGKYEQMGHQSVRIDFGAFFAKWSE